MTGEMWGVIVALIALVGVLLGQLYGRIGKLEDQITDLWEKRKNDALTIRGAGGHIDKLEHHIWQGKPPPPPERPEGI